MQQTVIKLATVTLAAAHTATSCSFCLLGNKKKTSEDGHMGESTHHMWLCASSVCLLQPLAYSSGQTARPALTEKGGSAAYRPVWDPYRPRATDSGQPAAATMMMRVCCLCVRTWHDCPSSSRVCLPRDESRCLQRENERLSSRRHVRAYGNRSVAPPRHPAATGVPSGPPRMPFLFVLFSFLVILQLPPKLLLLALPALWLAAWALGIGQLLSCLWLVTSFARVYSFALFILLGWKCTSCA